MPKVVVWVLTALALVGVLLGALWVGQRALIFFPDRADPGRADRWFARGSDVTLHTSDGLDLRAWRVDPAEPNGYAVVYLPGNGGNRAGRVPVAEALTARGFTVLLVDYRGYGGNPGSPSEEGLIADALAAVDLLVASGFAPERLIYVGESVGTGVATALAIERPPAGVLLRSPYTSLDAVARAHYKVPLGWLLRDHFDTASRIGQVSAPVTVLAGDADTLIDPAQSEAVAAGVRHLHAWDLVEGAGHNDEIWFGDLVARHAADLVGVTT